VHIIRIKFICSFPIWNL